MRKIESIATSRTGENPIAAKQDLQQLMWKHVGVMKNEKGLKTALQQLESLKKKTLKTGSRLKMNEKLVAALDLNAMWITCEMIIKSAGLRKESRAAHARSDYPKKLKKWNRNIICAPSGRRFKLTTQSLDPVPPGIKKLLKKEKAETKLLE